jgi:peroxiredoxin
MSAALSLRETLTAMKAERPSWYRALLDEIAERLRTTACEAVLRPGNKMPDFVLPNAEGELVFSDDLLARGPLVVCFFRGGWCPFCSATLQALEAAVPDVTASGASLVGLTPDTSAHVLAVKLDLHLSFDVLSDVDCAVGLQFGTVYRVPDSYADALRFFGIDLIERHGTDALLLPMPALFVSDSSGIIRVAHASGDITDRVEPASLAATLGEIAAAVRARGSAAPYQGAMPRIRSRRSSRNSRSRRWRSPPGWGW